MQQEVDPVCGTTSQKGHDRQKQMVLSAGQDIAIRDPSIVASDDRTVLYMSKWTLIAAAIWMGVFYVAWKIAPFGQAEAAARFYLFAGFGIPAVWAVLDYRSGILLTLIALPFFDTPRIPSLPMQGMGDVFALATCTGFLIRHPDPRSWLRYWRPSYWWMVGILAATLLSILARPYLPDARFGVKYGFAEFLGIGLLMSFCALLVSHVRTREDLRNVLFAARTGLAVALVFGAIGLAGVAVCYGGFSSITAFTNWQRPVASFGGPNVAGLYFAGLLPLLLLSFVEAGQRNRRRAALGTGVILTALILDGLMSRAVLVVFALLAAFWIFMTRWRPGLRAVTVLLAMMVPLTFAAWYFAPCTCADAPQSACKFRYAAELSGDDSTANTIRMAAKNLSFRDLGDPIRIDLASTALSLWQKNPLTGVGAGMMPNYAPNRAHNILLTMLAEQGLIGFAMLAGLWATIFIGLYKAWRSRPDPANVPGHVLLAFLAVTAFVMFHDGFRILLVWVVMGIALATAQVHRSSKTGEDAPAPGRIE